MVFHLEIKMKTAWGNRNIRANGCNVNGINRWGIVSW